MTKLDVFNQVSKQTGLDPFTSRSIIESFFEVVKSAVVQGDSIHVRTFGTFGPKHRAAKVARNISQNTAVPIEAHTVPYFKPSLEFVNQVRLQKVETELVK